MKAAELADEWEKADNEKNWKAIENLSCFYNEKISKSLRFAADMEVLRKAGVVVSIYPQSDGSVHLMDYKGRDYVGSDIYSAARAAVEALEEKR